MNAKKKSVVFFIVFLISLVVAAACYSILAVHYIRLKEGWLTSYAAISLAAAGIAAYSGFRFALSPKSAGKMLAVSGLFFCAVIVMLGVVLQHPESGSTHISTGISLVTFWGMVVGGLVAFILGIMMFVGKQNER